MVAHWMATETSQMLSGLITTFVQPNIATPLAHWMMMASISQVFSEVRAAVVAL
jgi:hypothetical protein